MVKNKVCRNAAKAVACDEQQPFFYEGVGSIRVC